MFPEMRKTALLICEEKPLEEILRLSLVENIYQLEKEKRRRDVPMRMFKRLSNIDRPLVKVIAHGMAEEAKLVAFLAFIKADRLVFEYMREVYADKAKTGYDEITDMDFMHFIDRKIQDSDVVAGWSATTTKNVGSKIKSTLCEAGLAKRSKAGLVILKPLADDGLKSLLTEQDKIHARAMCLLED